MYISILVQIIVLTYNVFLYINTTKSSNKVVGLKHIKITLLPTDKILIYSSMYSKVVGSKIIYKNNK